MNILFDIGHPAHVHLFKYVINDLKKHHHKVYVLAKSQKAIIELLQLYKIDYEVVGEKKKGLTKKFLSYFSIIIKSLIFVRKNKIDIGIGVSMSLPIIGKLSSMKVISMDDDDMEVTPVFARFANMADIILTPDALSFENRNVRHISYRSYHELAYLHPNRFSPNSIVLERLGVNKGEPYFVLRFNSFDAHHDINEEGLSFEQKIEILNLVERFGKVFISTETANSEFKDYQLPIKASEIHSAMYYSRLFIGDSQTMTSEAAVLGIPAIKCNTFAGRLSIPNELENKYGLCYSYQPADFEKLLEKLNLLLKQNNLKEEWERKRKKLLKDKQDLSEYLFKIIVEQK